MQKSLWVRRRWSRQLSKIFFGGRAPGAAGDGLFFKGTGVVGPTVFTPLLAIREGALLETALVGYLGAFYIRAKILYNFVDGQFECSKSKNLIFFTLEIIKLKPYKRLQIS
jgi:hypothetical protein